MPPSQNTSRSISSDRHVLNAFVAVSALVITMLSIGEAVAVTIDWATVENPGNANDPASGGFYGAVNHEYRIAKHPVTIQQYTDFLNAVGATDLYSLYNENMALDLNIAGILRSGTSGGFTYSVINNDGSSGSRPITYVSWFDAARFANWMHNGQGSGDTETGAYVLAGAVSGTAPSKNPGAKFYIPTENEWYKAAFYSPVKGDTDSPGYYMYATQSDSPPGNTSGSTTNQANYVTDAGYSVTQLSDFSSIQNYLTDVGAFTNSASHYGTFDQNGNVFEWNDLVGESYELRGLRGGNFYSEWAELLFNYRAVTHPFGENSGIGFRLASPVPVPEPSTWLMAAGGLACAGWGAWRRRRAR